MKHTSDGWWTRWHHVAGLVLTLLTGLVIVSWERATFLDLDVYLAGGRALLNGQDLYGRLPDGSGLPFTYPPFAALLFLPLVLVPVELVRVVWTAASLVLAHLVIRDVALRGGAGTRAAAARVDPAGAGAGDLTVP